VESCRVFLENRGGDGSTRAQLAKSACLAKARMQNDNVDLAMKE
jgi:hypothetical protein